MTSAIYLKNYVERVQDVPAYLRRHLALIRDLDEKVQGLQQEIEQNSSAKKKNANYDLESQVTRLVSIADEKVTIAAQIYDFIDKHIQSLDEDLKSLDTEIKADKDRLGMCEDESAALKLESTKNKGRGRSAAAVAVAEGVPEKKRRGRKRAVTEEVEEEGERASLLALPVENEPLYCYCQKPSHGEMVACDNEECALEWFHYECVGLTAAPVGEWHCPDCVKMLSSKAGAAH